MHLEKQKYIYIISRSNVHLILTILGKNILAVRNAAGKVQIPRFSKGIYVTLLGGVMNTYLGALHACCRLLNSWGLIGSLKAGAQFFGEAKDREVSLQTITAPAPSVLQALFDTEVPKLKPEDKPYEIQYI